MKGCLEKTCTILLCTTKPIDSLIWGLIESNDFEAEKSNKNAEYIHSFKCLYYHPEFNPQNVPARHSK